MKLFEKKIVMEIKRAKMDDLEFIRKFNVDEATPFYQGILELIERLKEQYLGLGCDSAQADRVKLDALAAVGALDEMRLHVIQNRLNAKTEHLARTGKA